VRELWVAEDCDGLRAVRAYLALHVVERDAEEAESPACCQLKVVKRAAPILTGSVTMWR
jgi:hypothetical protein